MKDVLFICKSNINRSQQAEGFYNAFTSGSGAISAAIELDKDLQETSKTGIMLMLEKGIDISGKKSTLINKKMLEGVKKVVVICPKSFLPKYVLEFENIEFWKIKDPHYSGMDDRRAIRDEIEKRVRELIASN